MSDKRSGKKPRVDQSAGGAAAGQSVTPDQTVGAGSPPESPPSAPGQPSHSVPIGMPVDPRELERLKRLAARGEPSRPDDETQPDPSDGEN